MVGRALTRPEDIAELGNQRLVTSDAVFGAAIVDINTGEVKCVVFLRVLCACLVEATKQEKKKEKISCSNVLYS